MADAPVAAGLEAPTSLDLLRTMCRIRAFDSVLSKLYTQGLIRGSSHAAIGQEAVAVGACAALRPDDYITSTHRGHGHTLAKGGDPTRMMAELLGREDGYCRGKGGSMHIADFSVGMLGANGIVGGGLGIAAGAALSISLQGGDRVALCFFGEGALNEGVFHEVANMAAIWQLPLVLVCENNHFAMSAHVDDMTAIDDLARRADSYGFPGHTVDGVDVLAVRESVGAAVERARAGDGPSMVVATCYRFEGHFSGDLMRYRDSEEAATWMARDPIDLFRARLIATELLSAEGAEEIVEQAGEEIAAAIAAAKESPMPDPTEAWEDVYA